MQSREFCIIWVWRGCPSRVRCQTIQSRGGSLSFEFGRGRARLVCVASIYNPWVFCIVWVRVCVGCPSVLHCQIIQSMGILYNLGSGVVCPSVLHCQIIQFMAGSV